MPDFVDSYQNYRVRKLDSGDYQAEMFYQCRSEKIWVPLNEEGYWADEGAYSRPEGVVLEEPMSREKAKQAMFRAMRINRVHLPKPA